MNAGHRWFMLAVVLLALFSGLGLLAHPGPLAFDEALLRLLPREAPSLPVRLLNRLASAPVWSAVVLFAAAIVWRRFSFQAASLVLLAAASAEIASMVSKFVVARQVLDYDATDVTASWWATLNSTYLFPSAHVVRVTLLLGLVSVLFPPRAPLARLGVFAAGALLLLLLGYARVDVHAHLPTDVLGGYLLGGACLALALTVAAWLPRRARRAGESARPA